MKELRNSIHQVKIGSTVSIETPWQPSESQREQLKAAGFRYSFKRWEKQVKTREEAISAARELAKIFPRDAVLLVGQFGRKAEAQAYLARTQWTGLVGRPAPRREESGVIVPPEKGWLVADSFEELLGGE